MFSDHVRQVVLCFCLPWLAWLDLLCWGGGGERPSLLLCDSATWWLCRAAWTSDVWLKA